MITFDTDPSQYRHWQLSFDGPIATLYLDVDEDGALDPGYRLKLNSYDLGVDIELADALNRVRFEHPEVRVVILASGKERVFCSGANIYMLGQASHVQKVNFCKFTNETRNGIEDSSANSGLKFLAAINGACAGGGYELALACDEIVMVDDRSSTVSLPEVALLGVLPGTGGLTRLVDKRKVRRDLADVFCTTAEGVRADRAKAWGLVDHFAPPARFGQAVAERAAALAALSDRPSAGVGVALPRLERKVGQGGWQYRWVTIEIGRDERLATVTVTGPDLANAPSDLDGISLPRRTGGHWPWRGNWMMRFCCYGPTSPRSVPSFQNRGAVDFVLACDAAIAAHRDNWFVRETIGFLRRTLQRLDISSRSLFAIIDEGSCFAGSLFELAIAADRSYMLAEGPQVALGPLNFSGLEMINGRTRLTTRFNNDAIAFAEGQRDAAAALDQGLVTFAPDELDWEDEIGSPLRNAPACRPTRSPEWKLICDLPGQRLSRPRFSRGCRHGRIRVFSRPMRSAKMGALKRYGSGAKPRFDWERV